MQGQEGSLIKFQNHVFMFSLCVINCHFTLISLFYGVFLHLKLALFIVFTVETLRKYFISM